MVLKGIVTAEAGIEIFSEGGEEDKALGGWGVI